MTSYNEYIASNFWKLVSFSVAVFLVSTEPSFAQVNLTPISTVLQGIIDSLNGTLGKAIAALAVIAVGITFMMGKMDWMFAASILFGIAIVFGAAFLAGQIGDAAIAGGGTTP